MECPHCNHDVTVRKNLRRGKSATPKECPECGGSLDKSEGGNRDLINK